MSDIKKINRGLWMSSFAWLILLVVSLALGFYLGMQYRMSALDGFSDRAVCDGGKVVMEDMQEETIKVSKVRINDKETEDEITVWDSYYYFDLDEFNYGLIWEDSYIYREDVLLDDDNIEDILIKKYDFDTKENEVLISLKEEFPEFFKYKSRYGKVVSMELVGDYLYFYATESLDGGHAFLWIDSHRINLNTGDLEKVSLRDKEEGRYVYEVLLYNGEAYLIETEAVMYGTLKVAKYDLENNELLSNWVLIEQDSEDWSNYIMTDELTKIGVFQEVLDAYLYKWQSEAKRRAENREKLYQYINIEVIE